MGNEPRAIINRYIGTGMLLANFFHTIRTIHPLFRILLDATKAPLLNRLFLPCNSKKSRLYTARGEILCRSFCSAREDYGRLAPHAQKYPPAERPFTGLFLHRARGEKKIDFHPPAGLPLYAENRNDSFTPHHFRFSHSASPRRRIISDLFFLPL